MPKLSKFQWTYLSYMVPLTHWKHNSRCVKTNLRFTFRGLRILELHTKSGKTWTSQGRVQNVCGNVWRPLYLWSFDLSRSISWIFLAQGSLNVPIEHHPTIRYMVYNGYYKVMSNIPKSWDIYQPLWHAGCSWWNCCCWWWAQCYTSKIP